MGRTNLSLISTRSRRWCATRCRSGRPIFRSADPASLNLLVWCRVLMRFRMRCWPSFIVRLLTLDLLVWCPIRLSIVWMRFRQRRWPRFIVWSITLDLLNWCRIRLSMSGCGSGWGTQFYTGIWCWFSRGGAAWRFLWFGKRRRSSRRTFVISFGVTSVISVQFKCKI